MAVPALPRNDVPPGIALGALALLAALFGPLVQRTPAWPAELPHLRYDERAVVAEHQRLLAPPLPASATAAFDAWDAWTRAAVGDDATVTDTARQRFAERLAQATGHVRAVEEGLREHAAARFLAHLDDADAPLTRIAVRHRLVGADTAAHATRAARLAWFALRWERAALHASDDGELEPMHDTLLRVPTAYQRAFVSWALDARCPELVGATAARPLRVADVRACARYREEFVGFAAAIDRGYPREAAHAATDVMLAVGLRRLTAPAVDAPVLVVDDDQRVQATSDAQAALVRAQSRYARMLEAAPSRLLERRYVAVVSALGDD